ncbi:MAG: zf-HC2 domain-containing protein [Blastocatellia bacterium]|nr:zf-HC2 domain-containing protein [Blastocatellia bacterium]
MAREKIVSYVAGTCSLAEKKEFEAHCLDCRECRIFLAILLRAKYLPIDEKEKLILERLYPLGELAARMAADSIEQSFEYLEMPA